MATFFLNSRLSARSEFEISDKIGINHWNKHKNRLGIVRGQPHALSHAMVLLTLVTDIWFEH